MMHDEEFLNEAITAYSNSKGIHSLLLELRERRRAEKEYACISDREDRKNSAETITEPLKELLELREQNKALKNFSAGQAAIISRLQDELGNSETVLPLACTKFKHATSKEWIAKLNEEVAEVLEAMYGIESMKNKGIMFPQKTNLLREMVDVSTVIRSMQYAYGFTDKEIAAMQKWVNENNARRGYFNEP